MLNMNLPITAGGYEVHELEPCAYGGFQGEINGRMIKWCYDLTISKIHIWNPIEMRRLIPGELDIVHLPKWFTTLPRFCEAERFWHSLISRGVHLPGMPGQYKIKTDMQLTLFNPPVAIETLPEGSCLHLPQTGEVLYFVREHFTNPDPVTKLVQDDQYTRLRFVPMGTLVIPVAQKCEPV